MSRHDVNSSLQVTAILLDLFSYFYLFYISSENPNKNGWIFSILKDAHTDMLQESIDFVR